VAKPFTSTQIANWSDRESENHLFQIAMWWPSWYPATPLQWRRRRYIDPWMPTQTGEPATLAGTYSTNQTLCVQNMHALAAALNAEFGTESYQYDTGVSVRANLDLWNNSVNDALEA
jgi:hypothetical protein